MWCDWALEAGGHSPSLNNMCVIEILWESFWF